MASSSSSSSSSWSRPLVLLLLSSLFLLAGLLFDFMPAIVESQIKRYVEIASDNQIRQLWSKPPVDVHSYYWLYEILNPTDFAQGNKAQVQKVGPYHFTSRFSKHIVQVSPNKLRITYNASRIYSPSEPSQPEKLGQDWQRPMTLLNPVYVGLTAGARRASQQVAPNDTTRRTMILASANRLAELFNESLFLNLSASQALLGRKLLILDKVRRMIDTFGLDIQLPESLSSPSESGSLFGYVSLANNTPQGPYEMYTGFGESQATLGDLISFRGRRRLTEFRARCNRLQASAGELRPMPLSAWQRLEMFEPRLCRLLHLVPTSAPTASKLGEEINYKLAREDFASAQRNPDNRCFCQNTSSPEENDYCSLDGALELAPCSSWAPIVLGVWGAPLPEQLQASLANWHEELFEPMSTESEAATPLQRPDPEAQIVVLRRLGVPARVDLTVYLFMRVDRDSDFRQLQNVPQVSYLPLVMLRETAQLPDQLASLVKGLESLLLVSVQLRVVMYLTGLLLTCWLAGNQYRALSRLQPKEEPASRLAGQSGPELSPASESDSNKSQPASEEASSIQMPIESGLAPPTVEISAAAEAAGSSAPPPKEQARLFSKLDEELANRKKSQAAGREAGWLLRVCFNLVRLFSPRDSAANQPAGGHRQNGPAAAFGGGGPNGHLQLSPDELLKVNQERQLEMLADKIDNWYNSNDDHEDDDHDDEREPSEQSSTLPASDLEGGGALVAAAEIESASSSGQVQSSDRPAAEQPPPPSRNKMAAEQEAQSSADSLNSASTVLLARDTKEEAEQRPQKESPPPPSEPHRVRVVPLDGKRLRPAADQSGASDESLAPQRQSRSKLDEKQPDDQNQPASGQKQPPRVNPNKAEPKLESAT